MAVALVRPDLHTVRQQAPQSLSGNWSERARRSRIDPRVNEPPR
jgi:hypothetical protein